MDSCLREMESAVNVLVYSNLALLNLAMKRVLKALWHSPKSGKIIVPFSNVSNLWDVEI